MPDQDKTGPQGHGPKTGRGEGDCSDEVKDDQSEIQEDVQSNEDCGQGRGLKPCGPRGASDVNNNK